MTGFQDRTLRVLTLNYEYPPVGGGGGYICKNVMDELAERGHDITVVTSQYGCLPKEERHPNLTIHRVPVVLRNRQDVGSLPSLVSYVPSGICTARRLLRRQRFDLISTHFAVPTGPAGYFLAKEFGLPNVLTVYGGDIYDPTKRLSPHRAPILRNTVRRMLKSADRVVSDSNDIVNHAVRIYGITRPITVIPPGVHPYNGRKPNRRELGLPEDKILLVTLGRLVVRKNNTELIEVVNAVRRSCNCHLVIMGDGPERRHLEEKIKALRLEEHISLKGRVGDEKFQIMSAADIYVSTAVHEGFGLVFLEAMECGLPVVCYNNGGQVDFLIDGATGFLVPLGDTRRFCERIVGLIGSADMRRQIGRHNRDYIKKFYVNRCADQYLNVFMCLLNKAL